MRDKRKVIERTRRCRLEAKANGWCIDCYKNRDTEKIRCEECHQKNIENNRKYRAAHPEKAAINTRNWRQRKLIKSILMELLSDKE